jgi:hypothetical protein
MARDQAARDTDEDAAQAQSEVISATAREACEFRAQHGDRRHDMPVFKLWSSQPRAPFNKDQAAFENELTKEGRAWVFQLFALALLIVLVAFSAKILLTTTPCGSCNESPAAGSAGQSATQSVDPEAQRHLSDQLARERESRLRADADDRAWARTFLTTVTGAVIGFLFGTTPARTPRTPGSDEEKKLGGGKPPEDSQPQMSGAPVKAKTDSPTPVTVAPSPTSSKAGGPTPEP